MKIALVRYKYTPYGGAERYMSRLIDGLLAAGHEVHLFAADWQVTENSPVRFHRVPVATFPRWIRAVSFARNCRTMLRSEPFDIVFSLERTLCQDVYRAGDGCHRQWLEQKNLGKGRLSLLLDSLSPLHRIILSLEKKLFADPGLRAVIANSARGKEEIATLYGVAPAKIHVIHNGFDINALDVERKVHYHEALGREFKLGEELRLLYVGSGFSRKGVPVLLEAAALLTVPFRLFVVGKGRVRHYQEVARRLGIGDKVVFTGPVKEVERFYLGSDMFVFPTLYDPFSNATLEAMACGLPVITTQFNGVAELISQGENGYVVADPLDAATVAGHIARLADADRRRKMGTLARQTAAQMTMAKNVHETMRVLEEVYREKRQEIAGN